MNDVSTAYIEAGVPTQSHVVGLEYVRRILSKYNEAIETITLDRLYEILTTHKTRRNTVLSYGSVKFITSLITKARGGWNDVDAYKKFKYTLWTNRFQKEALRLSIEEETAIIKTIGETTNIFIANHSNQTLYETSLMVLLVLVTNFRSSELQQLKFIHLNQLLKSETISIRIKKKLKPVACIVNKEMLAKIITILNQQKRYKLQDSLFTRSSVALNKKFKQLTQLPNTSIVGVQALRKVNTTNIIKNTSLDVAQTFNRHTNRNMTDQYYNTKSYVASYIDNVFSHVVA